MVFSRHRAAFLRSGVGPWQELFDLAHGPAIDKPAQDISEIGLRIGAIELARFDERGAPVNSVTLQFGFKEEPNVEAVLEEMARQREIDLPVNENQWIVHITAIDPGLSLAPTSATINHLSRTGMISAESCTLSPSP